MKVTASKSMSIEKIELLTTDELRALFFERIEDWVIAPMDILAKYDHTGWAILKLAIQLENLSGGAIAFSWVTGNPLLENLIFLDGDYPRAIAVEATEGCEDEIIYINPILLIELCKDALAGLKMMGPLAPLPLEELRRLLIDKAQAEIEIL